MKKIAIVCIDRRYSDGYQWEGISLDDEVAGMEPSFRAWAKEAAEKAIQAGEAPEEYEQAMARMREEYRAGLRIHDPVTGEWLAEGTMRVMHREAGFIDTEDGWLATIREYSEGVDDAEAYYADSRQQGLLVDVAFVNGEWEEA